MTNLENEECVFGDNYGSAVLILPTSEREAYEKTRKRHRSCCKTVLVWYLVNRIRINKELEIRNIVNVKICFLFIVVRQKELTHTKKRVKMMLLFTVILFICDERLFSS